MSVCRIAVCHDCGCYIDLDEMNCCWNRSFWWHETWGTLSKDYQDREKDQIIYDLIYTQALCRFCSMHWGHNVKIYSDADESYFDALYTDEDWDDEKMLKEISIDELNIGCDGVFE